MIEKESFLFLDREGTFLSSYNIKEKNLFERGKTKISVPLISCEDKNKEKRSLFEVGEIEKITKNQTKFAFYK
ncbi:MAG: hypothetical protein EGS53_12065 [Prevotella sp.]|nr:hypothetical protein [Prevotella sp.]